MRDADEIRAEIDRMMDDLDYYEKKIRYREWKIVLTAVFSFLRQLTGLLQEVVTQLETRGTE